MIITGRILAHGDQVNRTVGATQRIDHGRGGDADRRSDLAATAIVGRSLSRPQSGDAPKKRSALRAVSIDAVVFGGDEYYIVRDRPDDDVGEVQRSKGLNR
jgi:hypothetical protein